MRQAPPRLADALLERWLPAGVLGMSILGDLHQEYEELTGAEALRFPRLWYWRSALSLSACYALLALKNWLLTPASGESIVVEMMMTMMADLRFAFRMLLKTPLLSLIAIVTIGLGVGLTTHTFSSVYGSILRGLPVPGEDRLMHVDANRLELGIPSMDIALHDYLDLREQQTSFEDLASFRQVTANLAGEDGAPERFAGAFVSANALSSLGVLPELGRTFLPGEDTFGAAPLVVLGYHVWMNRFGGDRGVLGRTIPVNGQLTEIVGVMPEGFRFPFREDVWITHRQDTSVPRGEGQDLNVFGKLKEGTSEETARAELNAIAARLAEAYPESNEGIGMGLQPFEERFMPPEIRAIMWVMLTATFGVLLIACANVANLLLARTSIRSKEVAVRIAMGAGRLRVIRQLMVESLMLAFLGGLLGLSLSAFGVYLFNAAIANIVRPYWIDIRMDLPVLVFSLIVTAVATVAAGVFPAVRASGVKIGDVLKDETRGSSSLRLGRFSSALVITEIAVSCGLLIGAGFMIKSVINVGNVELGFETENVMTGRVTLFDTDYPDAESRDQFFQALKERLESEPGVASAALASSLPGLGGGRYYMAVEGEAYATDRDYPIAHGTVVSEDLFATLGVDLTEGRDFNALETTIGGDDVVIVNESFVDRFLDGGPALGRRVRLGISTSERPWMTFIGVVPDMHVGGGVGGIGDDKISPVHVYMAKGSLDYSSFSFVVRTRTGAPDIAGRVRAIISELDPNLPVYELQPLGGALEQATWAFALFGSLFTIFGIAALFLASVGLYGVMAFSVSQRRQEMGVRMALGAERGAIMGLVLRKGAVQLGIGTVVGIALGAGMGQPLKFVLYGVETGDPVVYGSVVVTLVAAGLVACILPARTATRTDPVVAMRSG